MTMGDRICVMKDGIIQQFDTPQTLYNSPCNLFVAGFIGSPQMNFVDGTVEKAAEGYEIVFGETRVPCSREELAPYVGKAVVLGIRPEHLLAGEENCTGSNTLTAEVDLDEQMGSETFLYLNYAGSKMIAKVPPTVIAPTGSQVTLAVDPEQIHIFDKETEEAIIN